MANSVRTKTLGLAGALTAALATVTLANAPAQAATCNAPSGESCVRIINRTSHIHSARENRTNRCLTGTAPGRTSQYSNVSFNYWRHHLQLTGYTGHNCEGNTRTSSFYSTGWNGPDSGNFYTTTLYNA
ncbi:hypothetical protein OG205_16615 [Lentzea sp. NBC_00516]|uniref:hypothetical protein n=1 Tax=Lentzea sp. NBC_00516 TaxID=2903582 RepID=UPI002E801AC3|nr:hypothetical protein [Lentzea sp. NBC_00516]WUD28558.1 hypothetical protein OG205_16615 [Lentzea sp. NBC_00516]